MKRVFWIALILLLAASGFGYGFFHLLEQNEKLARVEWLYRYERLAGPPAKTVGENFLPFYEVPVLMHYVLIESASAAIP